MSISSHCNWSKALEKSSVSIASLEVDLELNPIANSYVRAILSQIILPNKNIVCYGEMLFSRDFVNLLANILATIFYGTLIQEISL